MVLKVTPCRVYSSESAINSLSFKIDKIKNDFNSDHKINIRDLLIMIKVSDETK